MEIDAKTLTKNLSGIVHVMAWCRLKLNVNFTNFKVYASFVDILVLPLIWFYHTNTFYSIFLTTISPLTS